MCFKFKDYDKVARIKVMQWRLDYPNAKKPTVPQLTAMLADVPRKKQQQVGISIMYLTRR